MTIQNQLKLIALGRQLSAASLALRTAQTNLSHAEKKHGAASPQAEQAAQRCDNLSLRFSKLQQEYLAFRAQNNV